MARGLPDYGNPEYIAAGKASDPGALMLALRGIASVDGLGRLFLVETWGEGQVGWLSLGGGAPRAYVSVGYAEIAPGALVLPGSLGPTTPPAGIMRGFYLPLLGRLGVELSLLYTIADLRYSIYCRYWTGAVRYDAEVSIDETTGDVSVNTTTGYMVVANIIPIGTDLPWVPIKLVLDYTTGSYVRLMIGQCTINLSNLIHTTVVTIYPGYLSVQITSTDTFHGGEDARIGHVFVTLDEP